MIVIERIKNFRGWLVLVLEIGIFIFGVLITIILVTGGLTFPLGPWEVRLKSLESRVMVFLILVVLRIMINPGFRLSIQKKGIMVRLSPLPSREQEETENISDQSLSGF